MTKLNSDVPKMTVSVFDRTENIGWRKEEMLVTSSFSFSYSVLKVFFFRADKTWDTLGKLIAFI